MIAICEFHGRSQTFSKFVESCIAIRIVMSFKEGMDNLRE